MQIKDRIPNLFLSLIALATLLVSAHSAIESVHASESHQESELISDNKLSSHHYTTLASKAEARGTVRLIVGLRKPASYKKRFKPEGGLADKQARKAQRNAIKTVQQNVLAKLPRLDTAKIKRFKHIPYIALEVDANELQQLTRLAEVSVIEEDHVLRPTLSVSVPLIGADQAFLAGYSGAGQAVAILDSGVDTTHPFFAGKIVYEACFSTTNVNNNISSLCPNQLDEQRGPGAATHCSGINGCYHGSHVAGIAAGNNGVSSGVSKDSQLIPIQVFSRLDDANDCAPDPSPCLVAYTSDIIQALDEVYAQRDSYNIVAANLSLGGSVYTNEGVCDATNTATKAAIDNLRSVNIATVISSGNAGRSNAISVPGCISTAISVGATTKSDGIASFSNSASWLSILAPGVSISSSLPGGGYGNASGTSMAAPHVTGAWGVLRSKEPLATNNQILTALQETGISIADSRNGFDFPRIQVDAAGARLSTIVDSSAITLGLEPLISGLNQPVSMTHADDGLGRLFITQQSGEILIYDGTQILSTPFLDISDLISIGGNNGLLSTTFHPDFLSNGFFYVQYTNLLGEIIVARYTTPPEANIADPLSELVLLSIPAPPGDHFGGQLQFGPDGYLYIALGDGGSGSILQDTAQDKASLLGKLLRIDPDAGSPYTIPADNPFVGDPLAREEIWALGFRNPWRFSFDQYSGDLYIADVGQDTTEEINHQPAASVGGENYGWKIMEGSDCFLDPLCDQTGLVSPVTEYGHTQGCSVTGGSVYRGEAYPTLEGVYFYSDFCSGKIWGLKHNGTSWVNTELLDTTHQVSSFGEGEDGNLYLADYSNGTIYRLQDFIPLGIQTTSLPDGDGTVGTPYSQALNATGGTPPYSWSVISGSLPAGLVLDEMSGEISGTPSEMGTANFTVQVTGDAANAATQSLSLTILDAGTALFFDDFEDGNLAPWNPLQAGQIQLVDDPLDGWVLRKSGNNDPHGGWVPFGLTVSDFELLLFTRKVNTAGGNANRYGVTDAAGNGYGFYLNFSDSRLYLESRSSWSTTALANSSAALPGGMELGQWYTLRLARQGDQLTVQAYVGRVDPAVVAPLLEVSATDTSHSSFTQMSVNGGREFDTDDIQLADLATGPGPLTVETATLSNGRIDAPYFQALIATGGTPPYSWSVISGSLPAGLVLDETNEEVSGTPSTELTSNSTVQVHDSVRAIEN